MKDEGEMPDEMSEWIERSTKPKILPPVSSSEVVRLHVAEKPTTGSNWADKQINDAVESALLRLQPIIRDTLRAEIKRVLQIEEIE